MQQLFMIPTFRKAILEVEDTAAAQVDGSVNSSEENMLHQLKMIFGGLMEMEKQYFNPKRFCSAFKDIDGQPIDPMVQKDVDEFFIMAMDRIENLVKGKKEDRVIKNLVQGVLANEFICKDCPHYSEREEPFMTISLQVKNKHSIRESLEAFVEGEMLEGDNAYYCEKCEKKVATLKRCCIKRLPNVLFMVLKRFEFNFDTMTKFKINDYCEYPKSINMQEYSQEGLAKKDLIKMMEEKNLTMEDLSEEQRAILEKDIPAKYYDYHLRGTVVHIGTAEQGHYISYI
jgi:ubiquitin carboxyl-terminal hydrolase 9/24